MIELDKLGVNFDESSESHLSCLGIKIGFTFSISSLCGIVHFSEATLKAAAPEAVEAAALAMVVAITLGHYYGYVSPLLLMETGVCS